MHNFRFQGFIVLTNESLHKSLGRFRSDREKTRKAEISRDFSAFFAPNFFQISIDPFSIFLRVEGFELPKMRFFKNRIRNPSDRKDLNPRQGFKFFRFFALDTNCLQIVPSKTDPSILRKDSNPRNPKKSFFRNRSIVPTKGFEPANPKYCPTEDKEKATANRGIFFQVKLPDKLEFVKYICCFLPSSV